MKVQIKLRKEELGMGSAEGGIRSREKQKISSFFLFSLEKSIVVKVLDIDQELTTLKLKAYSHDSRKERENISRKKHCLKKKRKKKKAFM